MMIKKFVSEYFKYWRVAVILAWFLTMCLLVHEALSHPDIDEVRRPITGLRWDEMIGTTWYIMDGNKKAMERWKFYKDSMVVDIDHFKPETKEIRFREKHIGKVCRKDAVVEFYVGSEPRWFRATELQWKRMTPSMVNPQTWTSVYGWSEYQMWTIEYILEGLACIGDTPNCYTVSKVPLTQIDYGRGWVYDKM